MNPKFFNNFTRRGLAFTALAALLMFSACAKKVSPTGEKVWMEEIPLPKNIFTLYDEAMAVEVYGEKGLVLDNAVIDFSKILTRHKGLEGIIFLEHRKKHPPRPVNFWRKGNKLTANLEAGKKYVVVAMPRQGSTRDAYDVLCMFNRFKPQYNSNLITPLCTVTLCAPEPFPVKKIFREFRELKPLHDSMMKGMTGGENLDMIRVGGHFRIQPDRVCTRCEGFESDDPVDSFVPSLDCIVSESGRVAPQYSRGPEKAAVEPAVRKVVHTSGSNSRK